VLDNIKSLGFKYATKSGITIGMNDIRCLPPKRSCWRRPTSRSRLSRPIPAGSDHEDERYNGIVGVWMEATDNITHVIRIPWTLRRIYNDG